MEIIPLWSSIVGSIALFSAVTIIMVLYLHKRLKRASIWQTPTDTEPVIHSAPTSRRSSLKSVLVLEKSSPLSLARSVSFGEDLPARLQSLTSNTSYQSYTPAVVGASVRPNKSSLSAHIRFPVVPNPASISSANSITRSIMFQLRYEPTAETLSITIFQLHNYTLIKNTQTTFLILYLLPDEDQQQQTQFSTDGTFNEHFHFPLPASRVHKCTLRLTAYTVDSVTRVRSVLGHVFFKLDRCINKNTNDIAFSTDTISEALTPDLQVRPDHLGQLVLTSNYLKDRNLLQIRIQQIKHLHIDPTKIRFPMKAHLSGQISTAYHKHHQTTTTSFLITSLLSFRLDQELHLSIGSDNESPVTCHLRLHFNSPNQVHSHARWQQSLQSNLPTTFTIPLVAF